MIWMTPLRFQEVVTIRGLAEDEGAEGCRDPPDRKNRGLEVPQEGRTPQRSPDPPLRLACSWPWREWGEQPQHGNSTRLLVKVRNVVNQKILYTEKYLPLFHFQINLANLSRGQLVWRCKTAKLVITGGKNNPLNSIQQTCTHGIDIWIKQGFLEKKTMKRICSECSLWYGEFDFRWYTKRWGFDVHAGAGVWTSSAPAHDGSVQLPV